MGESNHSKAKGTAGEWLVAGLLQIQGAERGFRIADINVDDHGTDLILIKSEDGKLKLVAEIQVKTATRLINQTQSYFGVNNLRRSDNINSQRFYIFLFWESNRSVFWLMREDELSTAFSNQINTGNVQFSINDHSLDRASESKVQMDELLDRLLLKLAQ